MENALGKGLFLVATPSLRDPNFRQTVILLCEHGREGALGVVVNRPTKINITEVLPHVPILEGQRHMIYAGGPVQPNNLLILYRMPEVPENAHHVFDGVYLGGNVDVVKDLVQHPSSLENFRAFIGYSGWAPGQLEHEMETGSWVTLPADPTATFEMDPSQLWGTILRSLSKDFECYADMPIDPHMN